MTPDRAIRVALVLAALTLSIVLITAHDESAGAIEARLHGLVEDGARCTDQMYRRVSVVSCPPFS